MAQSTILAAGITAGTSTDITVAVGAVAKVGIFCADADASRLPADAEFLLKEDTPSTDNTIVEFGDKKRSYLITAPGTYRVTRTAYAGTAFGVYLEA